VDRPGGAADVRDPKPCVTDNRFVQVDHWLATVDVAQLFDPPAVLAPAVAGWWGRGAGGAHADDVDGPASGGRQRHDRRRLGRVRPQLRRRERCADDGLLAWSFAGQTNGRVTVQVGGSTRTLAVNTGGVWRTIVDPAPVALPAGVTTVRVSAPAGGGGVWFLNNFVLLRR
jgi:hypothetical protein